MLTKNKVIQILREEQTHLKENFGVKKIAIFGSFAKGQPHQKSDVDIFIQFNKSLGMRFFDLMDYLEKNLVVKRMF